MEGYLTEAVAELEALKAQRPAIRRAGRLLAEVWRGSGCLFIAPTGHSLHTELTGRAGGPVQAQALDLRGARYYEEVRSLGSVRPGDMILIHSNCGNTPQIRSVVTLAHAMGVPVVALTQVAYERHVAMQPGAGVMLHETADITVDLGGVVGDAALELPGVPVPVCPTSGVAGAAAAWAIVAAACELLSAEGRAPAMLRSVQLPDAIAFNAEATAAWRARRGDR